MIHKDKFITQIITFYNSKENEKIYFNYVRMSNTDM